MRLYLVVKLTICSWGIHKKVLKDKRFSKARMILTLLEKAKLAREISDGKNEIPHKFFGRKI